MVTLKPLEHVGYLIKQKGKNLYVVNESCPINSEHVWGEKDLAKVVIYKSIDEARSLKSRFDKLKTEYHGIRDVELEVLLVHKKEIMVAKLKGSKDE